MLDHGGAVGVGVGVGVDGWRERELGGEVMTDKGQSV